MIQLTKGAHEMPAIFDGGSYNTKERQAAIDHYAKGAKTTFEKYNVYSNPLVKAKLESYFLGKCCYCESHISNHPAEVEHYRPKSSIVDKNGKTIKPGYYWLAADWNNLLLSCIDCNRQRYHEVPGATKKMRIGKLDQFPIADEDKRWKKYDDEASMKAEKEIALLVQPCEENPELFFKYEENGLITPRENLSGTQLDKAQESIRVYALQRMGLVNTRKEYYTEHAKKRLNDIITDREIIAGTADQQVITRLSQRITQNLKELMALIAKDKPYSAMMKYLLKKDIPEALGNDIKKYMQ